MNYHTGTIIESQLSADGQRRLVIEAPPEAMPTPGQYISASNPKDTLEPLSTPLFASKIGDRYFIAAPPFPAHWQPGDTLTLFGPLGRGFQQTSQAMRLALVGLDSHIARLEALLYETELEIAIFSDAKLPALPIAVEANPLSALAHAFSWADLIYVDLPLSSLDQLHAIIKTSAHAIESQVLIHAPMPCAGLAKCGVCAVPTKTKPKWAYACEKGPVFSLNELRLAS